MTVFMITSTWNAVCDIDEGRFSVVTVMDMMPDEK